MAINAKYDETYNIVEHEVDSSWKNYVSEDYKEYRKKWDMASGGHLFEFPLCVELESSYYCNLRCPMCARQALGTFNEGGLIDRKLYSKILDEAGKNKMPAIMLDHEAEPLTNPHIADMVKKAKEAGMLDVWMHTNANLLTEEISEKLIRNGLTRINFSVDAVTGQTYNRVRPGGDFNKVIKNITAFLRLKEELGKKYIRTRVSFAVQNSNRHEKEAFYDFWKEKINLIGFQTFIDFLNFDNKAGNSHKLPNRFVCYKIWQLLIIRYNGDVLPCGMPFRNYDSKSYLLGNLYKDSIKECWNSPKLNKIREFHIKGQYHKLPFCKDCVSSYVNID